MGAHYWDSKIRRNLIVQKRTREAEAAKKMKSIVDQTALFNANMLSAFMGQKAKGRLDQQRLAAKQAWRYGQEIRNGVVLERMPSYLGRPSFCGSGFRPELALVPPGHLDLGSIIARRRCTDGGNPEVSGLPGEI